MNLYKFGLQNIQHFFAKYGQQKLVRIVGVQLYRFSLFFTLCYLKFRLPGLKTLYTFTNFDSPWFRPGISDVDLVAVFSDVKKEDLFEYTEKIKAVIVGIEKVFPHVWIGGSPFFTDEFLFWYELNINYAHDIEKYQSMKLIYGQELRPGMKVTPKIETSSFSFRFFFEEGLTDIYYNIIFRQNNFRNSYKFFRVLAMAGYQTTTNLKVAFDSPQMKTWLQTAGCESPFINKLYNLSQTNFAAEKNSFPTDFIFNLNILVKHICFKLNHDRKPSLNKLQVDENANRQKPEPAKTIRFFIEGLNKDCLSSIFLTRSAFVPEANSQTLYLVLKNKDRKTVKGQIKNTLDNLSLLDSDLKKYLALKHRGAMYLLENVFPLVIFEELTNFWQFMNGGCLNESINIKYNATWLYGEKLNIGIDEEEIKRGLNDTVHVSFGPMNELLFKAVLRKFLQHELMSKTNTFFPSQVESHYEKVFNEKICLKPGPASYLKLVTISRQFYKFRRF